MASFQLINLHLDFKNKIPELIQSNIDQIQQTYGFLTFTKEDDISWNPLKERVWKVIDENVTLYKSNAVTKLNIDVEKFLSLSNDEKVDAVEMVLNRSIRKNLAQDGGGVEVKGIEGNIVKILYQGACGSCPTSSTGTLQFIQTQIRQQLHKDLVVKSI